MRKKRIYLASPYSHEDPAVRQERFEAVCQKAADLMAIGYNVFSPIAHSHPVGLHLNNSLDHDFWLNQDLSFLESWADEMWILTIDGWGISKGVEIEENYALENNIPIKKVGLN